MHLIKKQKEPPAASSVQATQEGEDEPPDPGSAPCHAPALSIFSSDGQLVRFPTQRAGIIS
ncbi:MAG: hypothetical protein PVF20_09535, partial [Desulfobacterales bacterium]